MKNFIIILLLFLLISCSKNKNEAIYGNWYFEKELPSAELKDYPNRFTSELNFEISNDSIIAFKTGFYHPVSFRMEYNDLSTLYYLGNKTKYKFINNSKIVFEDLTYNELDTIIITKYNNDELYIEKDKRKYLLKKKPKVKYDANFYDAIVVNKGPCFGSCPINSTYLNKNGKFIFNGVMYNSENNYFHSNLKKEQVSEVFNSFRNINVMNLNNNYTQMVTCSSSSSITFIKNNRIVKTISDYAESTPIDLSYAMENLSYLYQKSKMNYYYNPFIENMLEIGSFENKNSKYRLVDSEMSFLQNSINNGKKVKKSFRKLFELHFFENPYSHQKVSLKNIYTDGRYYQINYLDNNSITIDIGHNFVENNPIIKQKRIE